MAEREWTAGNPPIHPVRSLLHVLWSKAVGTSDYNKRTWQEFESQVEKLFEIHRAMVNLNNEKTKEAEEKLWRLFETYKDYIKIEEVKDDLCKGLPEPPPGFFK